MRARLEEERRELAAEWHIAGPDDRPRALARARATILGAYDREFFSAWRGHPVELFRRHRDAP